MPLVVDDFVSLSLSSMQKQTFISVITFMVSSSRKAAEHPRRRKLCTQKFRTKFLTFRKRRVIVWFQGYPGLVVVVSSGINCRNNDAMDVMEPTWLSVLFFVFADHSTRRENCLWRGRRKNKWECFLLCVRLFREFHLLPFLMFIKISTLFFSRNFSFSHLSFNSQLSAVDTLLN